MVSSGVSSAAGNSAFLASYVEGLSTPLPVFPMAGGGRDPRVEDTQYVEVTRVRQEKGTPLYTLAFVPSLSSRGQDRSYLSRNLYGPANPKIISRLAAPGYAPAMDPDALWSHENGVLSGPQKKYSLAAEMCDRKSEGAACAALRAAGSAPSAPFGAASLATYDAYDCENDGHLWAFGPES